MTAKKRAKPPKFRSRLAEAVHETATDLHRAGIVDEATMRRFDASCLNEEAGGYTPIEPK
jgi:putative transcriptional regulator